MMTEFASQSQLQGLSLREQRRRVGHQSKNIQIARIYHQIQRAAQQEISCQDARGIPPELLRRRSISTFLLCVHNVVVQERRAVDELNRSSKLAYRLSLRPAQPRRGQRQQRTKSLPTSRQQVARNLQH